MLDGPEPAKSPGPARRPFLIFTPDRQVQGMTLLKASRSRITPPETLPAAVQGVLWLHGSGIPVVDLRPQRDPGSCSRSISMLVVFRLYDQSVGFLADPRYDEVRCADADSYPDLLASTIAVDSTYAMLLERRRRPGEHQWVLLDYRLAAPRNTTSMSRSTAVGQRSPADEARVLAHAS
jgi:hypothetical protein